MSKEPFVELPIDVETLATTLYQTYCCNKPRDFRISQLPLIEMYASALRKNLAGGSVKKFLFQLKNIFRADGDSQHQLLLTQFIKEYLTKPERDLFRAHVALISSRIISNKMKDIIFADLD